MSKAKKTLPFEPIGPVEVFCKIEPTLVEQLLEHLAGTPHVYTQVHGLVQALLKVRDSKTTSSVPEHEPEQKAKVS